jgi:hypothetical protein
MNDSVTMAVKATQIEAFASFAPPIPAAWDDALKAVREVYPNAILAGGALRDLQLDRPVKDLDIFVSGDSDTAALDRTMSRFGFDRRTLTDFSSFAGGDHTVVLSLTYEERYSEAIEWEPAPPVNVVILSPDTTWSIGAALARFDFGLCQVAYDGRRVHLTRAFLQDAKEKTLTLIRCDTPEQYECSMRRAERLLAKYAEFTLVDEFKDKFLGTPAST